MKYIIILGLVILSGCTTQQNSAPIATPDVTTTGAADTADISDNQIIDPISIINDLPQLGIEGTIGDSKLFWRWSEGGYFYTSTGYSIEYNISQDTGVENLGSIIQLLKDYLLGLGFTHSPINTYDTDIGLYEGYESAGIVCYIVNSTLTSSVELECANNFSNQELQEQLVDSVSAQYPPFRHENGVFIESIAQGYVRGSKVGTEAGGYLIVFDTNTPAPTIVFMGHDFDCATAQSKNIPLEVVPECNY